MMDKYTIDFNGLDKELNSPKRIKLADVKNRIEKVGFGIVRFIDDKNKLNLWQVVDGDYIVAMYDEQGETTTGNWAVEADRFNKSATIFYKNTPIKSLALSEIGIEEKEINDFKKVLPERLANNKQLVASMLNSLDINYKKELLSKFPELNK
jgi:hypothetical protein